MNEQKHEGAELPMKRVVGFFDVNRVRARDSERLEALGWIAVNGDPYKAAHWRPSLLERLIALVWGPRQK